MLVVFTHRTRVLLEYPVLRFFNFVQVFIVVVLWACSSIWLFWRKTATTSKKKKKNKTDYKIVWFLLIAISCKPMLTCSRNTTDGCRWYSALWLLLMLFFKSPLARICFVSFFLSRSASLSASFHIWYNLAGRFASAGHKKCLLKMRNYTLPDLK